MGEHHFEADAGKTMKVARRPDGRYVFRFFASRGNEVGELFFTSTEGEKITDAMNNLRHEFEVQEQ